MKTLKDIKNKSAKTKSDIKKIYKERKINKTVVQRQ